MKYNRSVTLKNGKELIIRNGTYEDGEAVVRNLYETHAETDFLLSYPDEISFTAESEAEFLRAKEESSKEVMLLAVLDGEVVGTAGVTAVGDRFKVRHRAEFGIAVSEKFRGLGIGNALMNAAIECAGLMCYTQLELSVSEANERAVSLYKKAGFVETGRIPKGFNSRISGYQTLLFMIREL